MNREENIDDMKEFILKKYDEGCLFILEKYLDQLPDDYFDTLSFIFCNGIDQNKNSFLNILDEKQSEKFFKMTTEEKIQVFVFSDRIKNDKRVIWELLLLKEYVKDYPDPKKLFLGGENLRIFCDDRNLFYKSMLQENGDLISCSNLMWLKNEGENCRKPINENDAG